MILCAILNQGEYMRELLCGNCKRFKRSNFISRLIQQHCHPLGKIKGKCKYHYSYYFKETVFEDEIACRYFQQMIFN